jgi:putative phosphoesterase
MKIGLISDTHTKVGRSQKAIDHLKRCGAEFLIHGGDIVKPAILEQLKNSGLRYIAVYGNNDAHLHEVHDRYNLVQEPHYFTLSGTKCKLMHLPFYMSADTEVVIFGHTHVFECDVKNKTLFINAGEVCAREEPLSSCAMLEITPTAFIVTRYTRAIGSKTFDAIHYTFERSPK